MITGPIRYRIGLYFYHDFYYHFFITFKGAMMKIEIENYTGEELFKLYHNLNVHHHEHAYYILNHLIDDEFKITFANVIHTGWLLNAVFFDPRQKLFNILRPVEKNQILTSFVFWHHEFLKYCKKYWNTNVLTYENEEG